jgi:hypothetical protein
MSRAVLHALAFLVALSCGAHAQGIGVPSSGGAVPADFERLFAGLTATPSGTQTTSQILKGTINQFSTVTSANDGALLPPCIKAPTKVLVMNEAAANAMQVFASGSETIDGVAGATGVSVAAVTRKEFICVVPTFSQQASPSVGTWFTH